MTAQISLKKQDNGQYDDVYLLSIETDKEGKRSVRITEYEYNMLVKSFPFVHTVNPWPYPDGIAETAY